MLAMTLTENPQFSDQVSSFQALEDMLYRAGLVTVVDPFIWLKPIDNPDSVYTHRVYVDNTCVAKVDTAHKHPSLLEYIKDRMPNVAFTYDPADEEDDLDAFLSATSSTGDTVIVTACDNLVSVHVNNKEAYTQRWTEFSFDSIADLLERVGVLKYPDFVYTCDQAESLEKAHEQLILYKAPTLWHGTVLLPKGAFDQLMSDKDDSDLWHLGFLGQSEEHARSSAMSPKLKELLQQAKERHASGAIPSPAGGRTLVRSTRTRYNRIVSRSVTRNTGLQAITKTR